MSQSITNQINDQYKKSRVIDVQSGDTVRVYQKIHENNKERTQVFQGLVIRIDRKNSHTHRITVRRISSGVGVEKSFLLHSPLIVRVEVTKRSKVRRNYLSYMRTLTGKASRLSSIEFDSQSVNKIDDEVKIVDNSKDDTALLNENSEAESSEPESPKTVNNTNQQKDKVKKVLSDSK